MNVTIQLRPKVNHLKVKQTLMGKCRLCIMLKLSDIYACIIHKDTSKVVEIKI